MDGMVVETKPSVVPLDAWKKFTHPTVLLAGFVFLLAFIVRAQLMRYELFFEFDSYWHARMVSYILQGLPVPSIDPLAYYQNASAATFGNPPLLFWYVSAVIYKILTLNAPYDFELWVLFVKILPALYGAITCVIMYFLGRELFKGHIHEQAAGLLTGIFAAIVPSFVYRTMGGFFEDDSFGFIWMVAGFLFLVRALRHPELKRENIVHAALAGAGFGIMVLSWSGFNQLVPILLGVGFIGFLLYVRDNEMGLARSHAALWMISFIIFSLMAFLRTGVGWLSQFGTILGGALFGVELRWFHVAGFIVLLFAVCAALLKVRKNIAPEHDKMLRGGVVILILALVLAPLLVFLFNISLQTGDVLGQTVGEESEGRNYFGNKYSFMIIFAIIGTPACGYLLLKRAHNRAILVLPLVWLVVVFFLAWGKLKFTYYWGLPLALMSAVVCVLALKWMTSHTQSTQKIIAVIVGFFLIAGIAAGSIFVTQNIPNIEMDPGWKTALFWAQENLPEDTKFFNWWDEGHWITFLSGRKALIDNRNADTQATSKAAQFMLAADTNQAVEIVQGYESTHLIFGEDLLEKLPNLGFYAYGITNANDSRIAGMYGRVFRCSRQVTTLTKEASYSCSGNTFTPEQMNSFPTSWQANPNNLQQGVPFFIYRSVNNDRVYAFTQPANQTMLVRLWFNASSTANEFTPVYQNVGGVKIFQFNS